MTSYLNKFNSKKFHLYSNGKFVILNTTKTDERSGILVSLRQKEKKLCREDVQKAYASVLMVEMYTRKSQSYKDKEINCIPY